jgi:hypothetical protein
MSTHVSEGLGVAETRKPQQSDGYLGVDPNRNYAYQWGDDESGSSAVNYDATYRGTDPFSEQESKNVADLLKSHHATAMVTNHTSGDLLLWAWGDTRADAPDNNALEGLGRAMATYNGYVPQKSIDLYVTTGTTSDYAYGVLGSIGYTFEHAGSSFHPPYGATVPAMYAKNREAFILLASYACMAPEQRPAQRLTPDAKVELADFKQKGQLLHGIISGRAVDRRGRPVKADLRLTKTFDTLLWAQGAGNPLGQRAFRERLDSSMQAGNDGRFAWHVNPSTRPAVAQAKKTESYVLTITGPNGVGVTRRLVVKRGPAHRPGHRRRRLIHLSASKGRYPVRVAALPRAAEPFSPAVFLSKGQHVPLPVPDVVGACCARRRRRHLGRLVRRLRRGAPLVLTRTGRRTLASWWAGDGDDLLPLTLTCRLCGVGVDVPLHEEDDVAAEGWPEPVLQELPPAGLELPPAGQELPPAGQELPAPARGRGPERPPAPAQVVVPVPRASACRPGARERPAVRGRERAGAARGRLAGLTLSAPRAPGRPPAR